MKPYNLFISHSWSHGEAYHNLVNMLNQKSFPYEDYSIPQDEPIDTDGTNKALRKAITKKIRSSDVVLVLAGVYSSYSKWINIEIEVAKKQNPWKKPIILIRNPWGSRKISQHVRNNANEIVGWKANSIISAIKELKP